MKSNTKEKASHYQCSKCGYRVYMVYKAGVRCPQCGGRFA